MYSSFLGCETHAFEIQPAVACRLAMSATASGLDLHVHRNAVHSQSGKLFTFGNIPGNPGGVGLGGVTSGTSNNAVVSVRLDDIFNSSSILFMKIDTEGNEFEVLKSARNLLSSKRIKFMVIEIRPR